MLISVNIRVHVESDILLMPRHLALKVETDLHLLTWVATGLTGYVAMLHVKLVHSFTGERITNF